MYITSIPVFFALCILSQMFFMLRNRWTFQTYVYGIKTQHYFQQDYSLDPLDF